MFTNYHKVSFEIYVANIYSKYFMSVFYFTKFFFKKCVKTSL